MDEGDVVGQHYVDLVPDQTVGVALDRLEAAGDEQLVGHLPALLDGRLPRRPQEAGAATYGALRTEFDARINCSLPARRVHDFVRAQSNPCRVALSHLPDGRRARIWRMQVEPRTFGTSGVITERAPNAVVLACGKAAVRVLSAEVGGEGPPPPGAVLDSLHLRLGS